MVFGSIVSSPRASLTPQQALKLANVYLEKACDEDDPDIALVLCHDTEVSLSQAKRTVKHVEDHAVIKEIAAAYANLGKLLESRGHGSGAQASYKKAVKLGGNVQDSRPSTKSSRPSSIIHSIRSALHTTAGTPLVKPEPHTSLSLSNQRSSTVTLPQNIFPRNLSPPAIDFKPPEPDARLNDTPQLAWCLGLMQAECEPDDILNTAARNWLQLTRNEPDEQERLKTLATDVIRAFKRDEFKDSKAVTEVVYLAPVLENDDFRYLLKEFYSGIDQSGLLDVHQLEGIAQLVQGSRPGYLDADDLVKILGLLSTRLRDTHQQSTNHLYQLTVAVSHVLDAMADADVRGLDREKIHEPLTSYLDELKASSDPYLVYQAAYAYQALLCVPDNETLWQTTLRRTGKVIKGVSGLVSAVKGLDLNEFIEGLCNIQQGLAGVSEMVQVVKNAYDGAASLAESGQGFFECLKEGLSFSRKCTWYAALRGADTLIRDGQLAEFRKLVCDAPCRWDAAFQWGVCQRLGDIAANPKWDPETRRGAVAFLGEIYCNDGEWTQQANVKQWILSILMQLSSGSDSEKQFIETLLQQLRKIGDATKQALYRVCRENGPGSHPLVVALPAIGSPSLLDRVQERPDVEGNIRQLRRQRLKERGNAVYIQPQAKANLQARDESHFALMEKVEEYLISDQKVFLILGDSGAGKSTFNREFECSLWQKYKKKTGAIPLHINLPAIDKPEHDMIAKHLRKSEFTEPQIRELKLHRKFILICDGYDESQQTHNLYTSNRLNEPGEWNAKMVISCRSEYIGVDYRDRFQPVDRNHRSEPSLFQEAVMTPFSLSQVQDYITQYVSVHRPLWEADEYKKSLDLIPSLKDLVKNPFLMSLSLEVLPRIVDPGEDLTSTHITRMALYDQFIEHWLERGKKRVGEKNLSPQARSAFESLIDEGFTRNGIDYLKKLSVAIYKEQGGQPIVAYSRYKDENSWKSEFFSREEEKQLLREACPLIRSGNQYRFIHRSLLEYGLSLAVFDPQDWKEGAASNSLLIRRGSTNSVLSSDGHDPVEEVPSVINQEPDLGSPLAWRSFIKEPSVLQFLEERVQQEPLFKQKLLGYIEHSKADKKWRTAAANAITILVRAGVQFNCADLRGIQIPKADLGYGVFDSAQFQGANLREVDLRGAWLRQANLSQAQMTGVRFGELPFLKQESAVRLSVNSPDWTSLSLGLESGKVIVYLTSIWELLWTLEGHTEQVDIIKYSPNGHQIASGSNDGTVRLWDIDTGVCLHVLSGHRAFVKSVAYSPHGSKIASASSDCTMRVWDVETGDCRCISIGHTRGLFGVVYSPNGNQIASCSADGTVRLWDTEAAEFSHTLSGHSGEINTIVYSSQGAQIASASDDRTVRLWDVATGDCRHILTSHSSLVFSVIHSPKGDHMATASFDATVRLWDIETGDCLHTLLGHRSYIRDVAYSPQGDLLASASDDNTVRLWDVETGVCRQTLNGHSNSVWNVLFLPKGDQIASSSLDKTVRLWDVGTGTSRHITTGHKSSVQRIKCSPNGDEIASCSSDTTVRLWDVETGTCRHVLRGHRDEVRCVAYSPQDNHIATGSDDSTVRLWNVETGACTRTLTGHRSWVRAIAYSPQGDLLASASSATVRLWDVKSGECRYTLKGHTEYVWDVVYSPSGNQIASCSSDRTVRLWDVESGACAFTLTGHTGDVNVVMYSPQGDQLATASDDPTVRLWDVETGECRRILIGHRTGVRSITYSPKGDQIASGCRNGNVSLWDVETGSRLQHLTGHSHWVNRIVYSPRGDLVVTASDDKSVRLWDVASGQCRAAAQGLQSSVNDVAWIATSDIDCMATGCYDGSVQMWKVMHFMDRCQLGRLWNSTLSNALEVTDTNIQDVQGLSQLNVKLLKQRGAVGEPADRLREASKKVTSMASAVSKLKTLPNRAEEEPVLSASFLRKHLERLEESVEKCIKQHVEQRVGQMEQRVGQVEQMEQRVGQQFEQRVEQAKDELLKDVGSLVTAALVARDIQGSK